MTLTPTDISDLCKMASSGDWLDRNYNLVATAYYLVVAVIALSSVIVAVRSYAHNRREQLFANAIQTYRKHLELAVQYPNLAEPDETKIMPGDSEYSRYEWFVGVLLRACEELLEKPQVLNTKFPQWQETINQSLRYHGRYFSESDWFRQEGRKIYSKNLLKFIDDVVEVYRTQTAWTTPNQTK